jgi:hypothetical protein
MHRAARLCDENDAVAIELTRCVGMSQVMGTYFVSLVIMMRMNMPEQCVGLSTCSCFTAATSDTVCRSVPIFLLRAPPLTLHQFCSRHLLPPTHHCPPSLSPLISTYSLAHCLSISHRHSHRPLPLTHSLNIIHRPLPLIHFPNIIDRQLSPPSARIGTVVSSLLFLGTLSLTFFT